MAPRLVLKQRPDAGFEALYRSHVHDVYRYAMAILGNSADAEDVTQTTFLNAYRAYNAGERPRKPGNWVRAIAHNVCRQRFRQAARRPNELGVLDEVPVAAPVEDPDVPSAADIARALRSLPFNQRAALVMRELEGRRQAEIAEALDLSESAVEALLFRARRAMREQLESSFTCGQAERAISRQLDGSLPRGERSGLRAHLRECAECASFARQVRAQRGALKGLGAAVPLPASLLSWSAGGSGAAGVGAAATAVPAVGLGVKLVAGLVAAAVVAGAGVEGVSQLASGGHGRTSSAADGVDSAQPGTVAATAIGDVAAARSGRQRAAARDSAKPRHPHGAAAARSHRANGRHRHGQAVKEVPSGTVAIGGAPGHAPGAAATTHGTPRPAAGQPASSHGSPTRAHGQPADPNGPPPNAQGTPTRAHGDPSHPQHPTHPAHPAKPEPRDPKDPKP